LAFRKLYEIIGVAAGLVLLNFGFELLATGFPGTRQLTSQFLGVNLLVGGVVVAFSSLYFLLKSPVQVPVSAQPGGAAPDVRVELIIEETPPSQYGFYKNIEYIGYFFTALGLFSAVDLTFQTFIPTLYNETRWWVEVLLVTFGVLSYAIFGSIGRLGAQEEKQYAPIAQPPPPTIVRVPAEDTQTTAPAYSQILQLNINEFSKSGSGDYERQLATTVYDMFRLEREGVTVWRENREGMRSNYLAGPYELSMKFMGEYANRGEELKIGYLSIPVEALRDLMRLVERPAEGLQAAAS
jgi:hypothetical protein